MPAPAGGALAKPLGTPVFVSVLPHVILLPVASSAMLPGGLFPSPSDLIVSCKAVGQSDAGGGRSPGLV